MKKLFSLVALAGMLMLMSFNTPIDNQGNEEETDIYVDCFALANQGERQFFGAGNNDDFWYFIYDYCMWENDY